MSDVPKIVQTAVYQKLDSIRASLASTKTQIEVDTKALARKIEAKDRLIREEKDLVAWAVANGVLVEEVT